VPLTYNNAGDLDSGRARFDALRTTSVGNAGIDKIFR